MNYIVVSKTELEHYLYKTQSNNEIWYFWRKILKKMPSEILEAIKNKRTDLVHLSKGAFDIAGYKPYVFVSENTPESVNAYLQKYVVYVVRKLDEGYKTNLDVKEKLKHKRIRGRKY